MVMLITWSPVGVSFVRKGILADSVWLTFLGDLINLRQIHRPNYATPLSTLTTISIFMIFISIYIAFISWAWGPIVCNLIRYRVVMTDHFLILGRFSRRKRSESQDASQVTSRFPCIVISMIYRRSILVGCIWRPVSATRTTLTAATHTPCMFRMYCTHLLSSGLSLFAVFFIYLGCG